MSDEHRMEWSDFVDTAAELVNQLMDRIPEQWREGLRHDVDDRIQEPRIFMRELVAVLAADYVPITPDERDVVVRLMTHRRMDLKPVEQFNVVGDTQGPSSTRGV